MTDTPKDGDNEEQSPKTNKDEPSIINGSNNVDTEQEQRDKQQDTPNKIGTIKDRGLGKFIKEHHSIISTVANVIMAFGTIWAVLIASESLTTSNYALKLTRESMESSEKKDNAFIALVQEISKNISDVAKSSNDAIKQNTANNAFVRQTTINDSRGCLVMHKTDPIEYGENRIVRIEFNFSNEGKTTAKNIRVKSFGMLVNEGIQGWNIDSTVEVRCRNVTPFSLEKSGKFSFKVADEFRPSKEAIDAINSNVVSDYFAIKITYDDIYGIHHYIHRFLYWDFAKKELIQAWGYNDIN